ncbi:MAG: 2-amino-4-hydroxy-6-hydroxymethyldihydropteridine diphosphokinase [Saprospirales bacterium]|nr:MAG: 2-amino-4-hydroxy-6-hydroxymethyldihydropteridine diphosphokinase [Saprospirales bacterium]
MRPKTKLPKETVFLGLGSNLGNREDHLINAIDALNGDEIQIKAHSSVFETEAWGDENLKPFLNMVIQIETTLPPLQLLQRVESIERQLGRKSGKGMFQNRNIDIDILLFGKHIVDLENLKIPHRGLPVRSFVLEPLNELAPDLIHPVSGKTIRQLLRECPDDSRVIKRETPLNIPGAGS